MFIAYKFFPNAVTFSRISFTLGVLVIEPIEFYIFQVKRPPTTMAPDFSTLINKIRTMESLLLYHNAAFTNPTFRVSICFDEKIIIPNDSYILLVTDANVMMDSNSIAVSKYCTQQSIWVIISLIVLIIIFIIIVCLIVQPSLG